MRQKHRTSILSYVRSVVCLIMFLVCLPSYSQTDGCPLQGSVNRTKGLIGLRCNTNGYISNVRYDSPAQRAGIMAHDRIVSVNFKKFSLGEIYGNEGDWIYLGVIRKLPALDFENGVHYDSQDLPLTFKVRYVKASEIDYDTDPQLFYEKDKIMEWGPPA